MGDGDPGTEDGEAREEEEPVLKEGVPEMVALVDQLGALSRGAGRGGVTGGALEKADLGLLSGGGLLPPSATLLPQGGHRGGWGLEWTGWRWWVGGQRWGPGGGGWSRLEQ